VCADDEAAFLADAVRTSCDMLNGLASNVLELRKLERGELAPTAQPFSVRDAVRGVLQMCAMAKCGGADIVWVNEQECNGGVDDASASATAGGVAALLPERVDGDCVLVSLILQNLVVNSLKYGDGSRVSVHVTLEEAQAAPGGGSEEESSAAANVARAVLCVEVSDSGPGISGADQARIFAKYARAAPDKSGGAGLGLHISRGFARAMGGDISVRSAVGEGAAFTLRVPVRVLPPEAAGGVDAESDASDDVLHSATKKPRHHDAELSTRAWCDVAAPDLSARFTPEELARRPPLKDAFAEVSLEEMLTHVLRDSSEIFAVCKTSSGGGDDEAATPRYAYVSPSVRTVLGWSPDALLGAPCSCLVHPDDVDKHAAGTAALMTRAEEHAEPSMFGMRRMARADGSYRWMHLEVHREVRPSSSSNTQRAAACSRTRRPVRCEVFKLTGCITLLVCPRMTRQSDTCYSLWRDAARFKESQNTLREYLLATSHDLRCGARLTTPSPLARLTPHGQRGSWAAAGGGDAPRTCHGPTTMSDGCQRLTDARVRP
jgi:hypothetical protein